MGNRLNLELMQRVFVFVSTILARDTLVEVARQGITVGHLSIVDSTGTYSFGDPHDEKGQHVSVLVHNETFWTRVLLYVILLFPSLFPSTLLFDTIVCLTVAATWASVKRI